METKRRTISLLSLVLLTYSGLMDCLSTKIGINEGFIEGNPFANHGFDYLGMENFMVIKMFSALFIAVGLLSYTEKRSDMEYKFTVGMIVAWSLFWLLVAMHNFNLVLG